MKKIIFNKTSTPIIASIGAVIGILIALKVIADSQQKVDY